MEIKSSINNGVLKIMLIGELDEYTSNYTRDSLDSQISYNNFNSLVFDLSELDFMDSTGIGVLIGRYKKLKKMNKSVYISNPTKTIEKIFNMSGIFEIMPKIS